MSKNGICPVCGFESFVCVCKFKPSLLNPVKTDLGKEKSKEIGNSLKPDNHFFSDVQSGSLPTNYNSSIAYSSNKGTPSSVNKSATKYYSNNQLAAPINKPINSSSGGGTSSFGAGVPHRQSSSSNYIKVVVKSNYQTAGRNRTGFISKIELASKAKAAMKYQARNSAQEESACQSKIEYSNTYSEKGELLTKEQEKEVLNELSSGIGGMRRVIISPDPQYDLSNKELQELTKVSIAKFKSITGKEFTATFSIHNDTEVKHSHILMTSDKGKHIKWNKQELAKFKSIVREKTKELLMQKQKEHSIISEAIRMIEQTVEKLHQKISDIAYGHTTHKDNDRHKQPEQSNAL